MIEASGVSKWYGPTRAVADVSLTITPGTVTGLLGPNGAGKSTLLRMIACLLAPTSGHVTVNGHDTIDASPLARRSLGYLPEFAPLYHEMSAESYLMYRAGLFPIPRPARKAAVDRAIERCHLTELRSRRIGALSKGYRQRVGLAASILHDPKVLVLDEPTTGLDPSQIRESRTLFRELAQDRVVLLSSHILPEIEATCGRIIIMARGRVRADGTPDALLSSAEASHPWTLRAIPSTQPAQLEGLASELRTLGGVQRVDARAHELSIYPAAGTPPTLGEAIGAAAMRRSIALAQLSRTHATLEQLFLRVIEQPHDAASTSLTKGAA